METFTSDESLSVYISKLLCANKDTQQTNFQTGVVFVNKLLLNYKNFDNKSDIANSTFLSRQLLSNCDSSATFNQFFTQITSTKLLEHCQSSTFRRFTYLQLIFDLGSTFSTIKIFTQIMTALSEVYHACFNCLPFLLILSRGQRSIFLPTLAKWTTGLLGGNLANQLKGFRLVIVSSSTQKENVLHLNPILDGCLEYSGVYLPKTPADFARLKAKKCNLNNSTLSVSISRVIFFIYIFKTNF